MIYLGTDHAGFELKEKVKKFLQENGHQVEDLGALIFDKDDDYPDFIGKVGEAISKDPESKGIIFGGSGQGEAMVANKYKNVRAAVLNGGDIKELAKLSREHNNANVLSFGARFVKEDEVMEAIKIWLETPFTNEERHVRRIEKIKKIEEGLGHLDT